MKSLHEQYIVDESGNKTAVVLPVEEYEELIKNYRKDAENVELTPPPPSPL